MAKFFRDPFAPLAHYLGQLRGTEPREVSLTPHLSEEPEEIGGGTPGRKSLLLEGFTVLALAILLIRLFSLQAIGGAEGQRRAEENRLALRTIEAARGVILDRAGTPLVENLPSYVLEVIPQSLPRRRQERQRFLRQWLGEIGLGEGAVSEVEARRLQGDPIVLRQNLSRDEALELQAKLAGQDVVLVRARPHRRLRSASLSHVVGYLGKPSAEELRANPNLPLRGLVGKVGLEAAFDARLRGRDGKLEVEVNAQGEAIRTLARTDPVPGDGLLLELDLGLQEVLTHALARSIEERKAIGGAAVVLDPKSGAILALTSLPSFDANAFMEARSEERISLFTDPRRPLFNRAVAGRYPPGSAIKPVVAIAGLSEGVITDRTTINVTGQIAIPNQYNPEIVYLFKDWKAHGRTDIFKAIADSSNVFFYHVGGGYGDIAGLGSERLADWLRRFGLEDDPRVEIAGASRGHIPTPEWKRKVKHEAWYLGDVYHMAIGQNLLVTPLAMARSVAAIASGTLWKPRLVRAYTDAQGTLVAEQRPEGSDLGLEANVLRIVRAAMRRAVTEGSARQLADLPVAAAGKTGTAQNPHGREHAWFIGFAPLEDPTLALAVVVEQGGEGHAAAVPVAKEAFRYWFSR